MVIIRIMLSTIFVTLLLFGYAFIAVLLVQAFAVNSFYSISNALICDITILDERARVTVFYVAVGTGGLGLSHVLAFWLISLVLG